MELIKFTFTNDRKEKVTMELDPTTEVIYLTSIPNRLNVQDLKVYVTEIINYYNKFYKKEHKDVLN